MACAIVDQAARHDSTFLQASGNDIVIACCLGAMTRLSCTKGSNAQSRVYFQSTLCIVGISLLAEVKYSRSSTSRLASTWVSNTLEVRPQSYVTLRLHQQLPR